MKKLISPICVAAAVATCSAAAQDMGEEPAAETAGAGDGIAAYIEQQNTDDGEQIARKATEFAPQIVQAEAEAAEKVGAAVSGEGKFVSAVDLVKSTLRDKLNLSTVYDPKKKAMVVIGTAEVKIPDPANDKNFIDIRNVKATEAFLDAKAQIIRAVSQTIQTFDSAVTAVENTEENLSPEEIVFKKNLESFKKKNEELSRKLAILSEADAEAVKGVTLNDRFGAILNGIAKRLDEAFNPATISEEKIRVRDEVKAECARLEKELDALQAECRKLPKRPVSELNSRTRLTASMPLLGATVLTQAESWDKTTGIYQVALGVVWSRKLQDVARRTGCGDFEAAQKDGKYSVSDWMALQDLRSMLGPRKITDDQGRTIYMGIAAADMTGTVASRKGKRRFAEVTAQNFVVFSLFGDVAAFTEASRSYKEFADEETQEEFQKFTKSLVDVVEQKFSGDLQGCMPLSEFAGEVVHPISGRTIYVVPYYLDPTLAKDSMQIMLDAYAAAGLVDQAGQYREGVRQGAKQKLNEIRESTAVFKEGAKDGRKEVQRRINDVVAPKRPVVEGSRKSVQPGRSTGGAYQGDAEIDADF